MLRSRPCRIAAELTKRNNEYVKKIFDEMVALMPKEETSGTLEKGFDLN